MRKGIAALAASAALAGTGAFAQIVGAWDANDDGLLDEDEFSQGFLEARLFEEWDDDEDDGWRHPCHPLHRPALASAFAQPRPDDQGRRQQ